MNFERAKSFILTILVVISGALTWNIWTYQPTYEKIDQDQSDYYNLEVDKQDVSDVIKPSSVIMHSNKHHFQISDEDKIEKIQKVLSKWDLYSLKEISNVEKEDLQAFIREKSNTEVTFTEQVPFKLYKSVLNLGSQDIPDFTFDKIIFKVENAKTDEVSLYFVSTESGRIFQTKVDKGNIYEFGQQFYEQASQYPEYIAYQVNKTKTLYVQKEAVSIKQYQYFIEYLDVNNFKAALFKDPNAVRRESVTGGDVEYTDGTSLLSMDKDHAMISYINPEHKKKTLGSLSELLQQSIDFVNDHAGWEGSKYRFAGLQQEEKRVIFRLYVKGYPVFNESGMSEIEQIWGAEDIYRYQRPYFYLDSTAPIQETTKILPSGEEAISALTRIPNFDAGNIENLSIGYRLKQDAENSTVMLLEPAWYYQYGKTWVILPFEQQGGDQNGLE